MAKKKGIPILYSDKYAERVNYKPALEAAEINHAEIEFNKDEKIYFISKEEVTKKLAKEFGSEYLKKYMAEYPALIDQSISKATIRLFNYK